MVKLSTCLPWIRHTGKEEVQFLSFLTSASLPGRLNPWEEAPGTQWKRATWAQQLVSTFCKKKNLLLLARCKPWSSSSWYCHYTNWAVPTPKIIQSNQERVIYITFWVSVCVFGGGVLILYYTFCHFLPRTWVGNVTKWMKLKDDGRESSPNTRHYPSIFSVWGGGQTWGLGWDLNLKHSEQTAGLRTTQLISGSQKLKPPF